MLAGMTRLRRTLLLIALAGQTFAAGAAALSAQQIEAITQAANEAMNRGKLPALQIAIAHKGEIWSTAFGKADLEQDVAATPQSMFRTASIAKWLTATAALR